MDDQEFDLCECVFAHETVMRRLLSLLRQSQSYCTDSECYQDVLVTRQATAEHHSFLLMSLVIAFALFMYYVQPRTQRNFLEPTKSHLHGNDTNGTPPTPPPSSA